MAQWLFQPGHAAFLEGTGAAYGGGDIPEILYAEVDHQILAGAHRRLHLFHELKVAGFVEPEVGVTGLAEADLGPVQAGCRMLADLLGHFLDAGLGAVQAGDGRKPIAHRTAEKVQHAGAELFALEVPQRDVDAGDRE